MGPGRSPTSFVEVSDADLPSLVSIEATLDGVERALERLREGTYWRCAECGGPLEAADVERDPLVVTCAAHRARG